MILEVGSVAEAGVEVHELECGRQVVLREGEGQLLLSAVYQYE